MGGAGEISETIENSAEAPNLKRKENESSPQQGNCNLMGSFISPETEWHENLSVLRSPELVMEDLKGKDLVRHANSHSGPESLGAGPHTMDNADVMVEELTLNNLSKSLPGSSKSGDEMQMKGDLWQNFYKLLAESRDTMLKEPMAMEDGMDVGKFSLNHLGARRFPVQKHSEQSNPNVFEHLSGRDNHTVLGNSPTTFPMGIWTKVLPSSGFPQFLVKGTLKGKAAGYRHPGSYGTPGIAIKADNVETKSKDSMKGLPDILNDCIVKADNIPSLCVGGSSGGKLASDYLHGVSLRHWLKPGKHKVNKVERLPIFKQVVELVDSSHSKGVALQQLRPSYFMILPSNQVKYVGSFVLGTQMEQLESVTSQATDHHHLRRKRNLDQCSEKSHLLPAKHHKLNEDVKVSGTLSLLGGGLRRELPKGFDFENSVAGIPGFDPKEQSMLGEYHQPQSDSGGATMLCNMTFEFMQLEERWYASPEESSGGACPFTSNIYSLGVLLFELFCCFESREVLATAMLDLRHRILPSHFLSESPKEAGFCLWLLHPEPSSRPKSREVLLRDLLCDTQNMTSSDHLSASFDKEDAEAELLLHFLLTVKEQKERQAEKLVENLGCLRMDIEEVEKRHPSRIGHLSSGKSSFNEISEKNLYKEPSHIGTISRISTTIMNEERLMKNIDQLENAYFSMRSSIELPETDVAVRTDKAVLRNCEKWPVTQNDNEWNIDQDPDRVGDFFDGLCKYARYNKFEVLGTLRNGDNLNSANVICSLSFDRDEEYFAAAGVARKIKIFEYASLLRDTVDIHYPVVEMSSKSKLSCVCWNSYIKNYLASTDYDGTVQLWDASTGQGFSQYTEHQRRAWSVDFSHINPTKFASGSDDCSVKLWSINEKNCTNTIRNVANVCCVQFSAHSSNLLAFGSADYKIYGYDLRNTRIPWCTLVGHGKAVSYVKFVDSDTLASASTDNTLKLWDLNKTCSSGLSTNACSLTFSGHTNEKNFVGLSVSNGYISCGSETNEVYAYYKSLPMPITSHKFGSVDPISGEEIGDDNGQFVSSVCWREKSDMVVAANSSGCIKLLQMV